MLKLYQVRFVSDIASPLQVCECLLHGLAFETHYKQGFAWKSKLHVDFQQKNLPSVFGIAITIVVMV